MPCARVVLHRASHSRLSVCGWLAAPVCEALWYWVVMEEVRYSICQTTSKRPWPAGSSRAGSAVWLGRWSATHLPCNSMEEVLFRFRVEYDQPPADADDVVKVRAAACRWNVGDKYVLLNNTFFWMFKWTSSRKIGTMTRKTDVCT